MAVQRTLWVSYETHPLADDGDPAIEAAIRKVLSKVLSPPIYTTFAGGTRSMRFDVPRHMSQAELRTLEQQIEADVDFEYIEQQGGGDPLVGMFRDASQ